MKERKDLNSFTIDSFLCLNDSSKYSILIVSLLTSINSISLVARYKYRYQSLNKEIASPLVGFFK